MNEETRPSSRSLMTDSMTVETLRNFLSAPKPPDIGPVDILHVLKLMLQKAEDHAVYDSQLLLAESFGVTPKTIVRSQKRLEDLGWIASQSRKGRTHALSLRFENVPGEEPLRLKLTPESGHLVHRYMIGLQKLGRKRFPKYWMNQQRPSAQRILDRCSGDVDLAASVISHALNAPAHRKRAIKGLYAILTRWRKVRDSYAYGLTQRQQHQTTEAAA